ncbi:hypothetical protein Leryth_012323 [Lithospermum erythrorhizon]|nr:hypothetical protein Leryth_012323 [Lithospermum erythrorhizon]
MEARDLAGTKIPKSSPLVIKMVVLFILMICGIYVLSVFTNQTTDVTESNLLGVKLFDESCVAPNVEEEEIPYIHFPKPQTFSREECRCNPVRNFAIVSMQRSGSGWFETLLNSHTNLSSNGELMGSSERRANVSALYSTLDKVYNLDWFSSASKNECTAAVGFKWMLNQLQESRVAYACLYIICSETNMLVSPELRIAHCLKGLMKYHEEIANYCKRYDVHLIFLFRSNLLSRRISVLANSYDKEAKLLNGTHKSHTHSLEEAEILARFKPTINTSVLIQSLNSDKRATMRALEYFKSTRHILLYYEDVVKNRTKLVDVQKFLGLPVQELRSGQVKIHKGHLSQRVENWENVQKALKGTSYEAFLDKDLRL